MCRWSAVVDTQIADAESRIKQRLAQLVGPQRYRVWFQNSTRLSLTDGYLKVGVPNLFIGAWIENHYSQQIQAAAQKVVGVPVRLCFGIDPALFRHLRKTQLDSQAEFIQSNARRTMRAAAAAAGNGNGHGRAVAAGLDNWDGNGRGRQTLRGRLEDFVVGARSELAYSVARSVVERPGGCYKTVFFHGGVGLGKTHLLHGIANALAESRPDLQWRYVCGEEFTNEFLLALRMNRIDGFRHRYRALDVLLIDDVHFLANKRATQEEFLHTFNAIDGSGRQVVMASDAHPRLIGDLPESLTSRFISGSVVRIEPPDSATRCEILRRRAAAMGRNLPDDVITYVAGRIETNVRELEGALIRLVAYAALGKSPITIGTARQALEDHVARTAPILTVGDLEMGVATFFGLTPADLHSSRKTRTVALARNIAMYLARERTRLSLPEIGRLMGDKNHTTVLLAHRRIGRLLAADATVTWTSAAGPQTLRLRELMARIGGQIVG